MTASEARDEIHRALLKRGLGALSFTRHVEDRGSLKRDFSSRDVEHVLSNGTVGIPTWDEGFKNWTCVVSGTDLDGDELSVVVALDPAWERITVITGF
jgi:hypothetical protein